MLNCCSLVLVDGIKERIHWLVERLNWCTLVDCEVVRCFSKAYTMLLWLILR